jgi:hypothetical protein
MNTGIDDNIGLVVSALKQAAMFDNTVSRLRVQPV